MRAAIWAAVSSRPQADPEKDSISRQVEDAQRLASVMGWQVVEVLQVPGESREYIQLSDAITGMDQVLRPQEANPYRRLVELLDARALDVLICRARDRLGRTDSLIATVEEYARRAGCRIHSLQMPGTGQADSDLYLAAIERAGAQRELVELRRRTHYGMNRRARRGHVMASRIPFGYREAWEAGVRFAEVDQDQASAYLWAVRATLDRSHTATDITARLESLFPERQWSLTALRYILSNPYYKGVVVRRARGPDGQRLEIEAPGQHDALIDADTWQELQQVLQERSQSRRPRAVSLLSGLARCGYCGSLMHHCLTQQYKSGHQAGYYRCSQHALAGTCQHNYSLEARIIPSFSSYLQELILALDGDIAQALRQQQAPGPPDPRPSLQEQIDQIDQRRDRVLRLYEAGGIELERYLERDAALRAERDQILAEIQEAEKRQRRQQQRAAALRSLREVAEDLEAYLLDMDPAEANRWLKQILQGVYIKRGKVVRVEI